MLVGRHARPGDPVFPNAKSEHFRPRAAENLRADLRAAGCPNNVAGHAIDTKALRRTFATWLVEAEVDEGLRRRLMGHGAANVTDAHYTAKTMQRLAAAVAKIDLDLSTGEVVELPLRRAAGGEDPPEETDAITAEATARPQYPIAKKPE